MLLFLQDCINSTRFSMRLMPFGWKWPDESRLSPGRSAVYVLERYLFERRETQPEVRKALAASIRES